MKFYTISLLLFAYLVVNSQENKVVLDNLFGCWEYQGYVDTLELKPLGDYNNSWDHVDTLILNSDLTCSNNFTKGHWTFDEDKTFITLYKREFTESDKEMAKYFNQDVKEVTRVELTGLRLIDEFLYYKVASEEEPFTVYAKYKNINCPQ